MVDFFDFIGQFVQYVSDMWGRGLRSPTEVVDFMKTAYNELHDTLILYIHPLFIPFIISALGFALLHKIFRLNDKE